MTAPIWPKQKDRTAFYGNPTGAGGRLDPKWEKQNIVHVPFPWAAVLAWDTHSRVKGARVHKRCADSLSRVFAQIWRASGFNQAKIEQWGMHLFGGGFNYRLARGSATQLSSHSWGCAVDFDPARNGMGDTTPHFASCPEVLAAFEAEGWTWGGKWKRPDGMHWQAAGF